MTSITARVAAILIGDVRGAPLRSVVEARAEAGRGLIGDRYHAGTGMFSGRDPLVPGARALSLIDRDEIARCQRRLGHTLPDTVFRRNLVVEGISLADWRGRSFRIGEVVIHLAGRCAPCTYLSRLTGHDMRDGLYRGGGMRAAITHGGRLACGDRLIVLDDSPR